MDFLSRICGYLSKWFRKPSHEEDYGLGLRSVSVNVVLCHSDVKSR